MQKYKWATEFLALIRGNSFLDIIPGRRIEELHEYYRENPALSSLQPVAVVMGLAKCYHSFIQEVYPIAIRIADRFYVNSYFTEALQNVRKDVQKTLSHHARKHLKEKHKILGKRRDDITDNERKILLHKRNPEYYKELILLEGNKKLVAV